MSKKQAAKLTEGLLLKDTLENAEFVWKEESSITAIRVCIKRVDGKLAISSEDYSGEIMN